MIWSRSKVEVKGQGTLRRVLVARFADLPGQNTFPGFEIFPVARLSEFPGFVVFPGSIFPVVSRFLASGQYMQYTGPKYSYYYWITNQISRFVSFLISIHFSKVNGFSLRSFLK